MIENPQPIRIVYMSDDGWINYATLSSKDMIHVLNPHLTENDYLILSANALDKFDKDFLDALIISERNELVVDIAHAREVHKGRLRAQRQAMLDKLDVQAMRALESGDTAKLAAITARKQALRDITGQVDTALTLEQIKAIQIKDYTGLLCTKDDVQGTSHCLIRTRTWFKTRGLDFEDFLANGIPSDNVLAYADETPVKAILDHAYDRING